MEILKSLLLFFHHHSAEDSKPGREGLMEKWEELKRSSRDPFSLCIGRASVFGLDTPPSKDCMQ